MFPSMCRRETLENCLHGSELLHSRPRARIERIKESAITQPVLVVVIDPRAFPAPTREWRQINVHGLGSCDQSVGHVHTRLSGRT